MMLGQARRPRKVPTGMAARTHGVADPEQAMNDGERVKSLQASLTPLSDLDLMIKLGWGDTPQTQLPADWRERKNE